MSKIEGFQHPVYRPETWNPTTGCQRHPDRLETPLHWRKPRLCFVASIGDLFHEDVPFEFVAAVFGVMAACPESRFVILTNRIERAREWFRWVHSGCGSKGKLEYEFPYQCILWANQYFRDDPVIHALWWSRQKEAGMNSWSITGYQDYWPFPNVAFGVSVSTQADADYAVPVLLECPAALRVVSYEPAIEAVDFDEWVGVDLYICNSCGDEYGHGEHNGDRCACGGDGAPNGHSDAEIDWLLIGGESGPSARPCDVEWLRAAVRQCQDSGLPCFVKQVGSHPCFRLADEEERGNLCPTYHHSHGKLFCKRLRNLKGADPSEWPTDLRVREYPEAWLTTNPEQLGGEL